MEKIIERICAFWVENKKEIIESVSNEKQEKAHKKKRGGEKAPEENGIVIAMLIPGVMGVVYIVVGGILLLLTINQKIYGLGAQDIVISMELIVLGIYALLHAILSCSEHYGWEECRLTRVLRLCVIILIFPYHLCIKTIKRFIKNIRQEHVTHLFPYYLISAIIVMFTYILIINIIAGLKFDEMFNEVIAFGIVLTLLKEFFWVGEKFAYHITKSIIKSVQKAKIKKLLK